MIRADNLQLFISPSRIASHS